MPMFLGMKEIGGMGEHGLRRERNKGRQKLGVESWLRWRVSSSLQ